MSLSRLPSPWLAIPSPRRRRVAGLLLAVAPALLVCSGEALPPLAEGGPVAGWPAYGGDPGGTRYSPLEQITPANVDRLEVAWTFRTGDWPGDPDFPHEVGKTAFQATPVLDEDQDLLYLCSPTNRVFALDAETGTLRWQADARPEIRTRWTATCRGVALWRDAAPEGGAAGAGACRRRVFMGTMDARLVALDAATGRPCRDFGRGGEVDLTRGLGGVEPGEYYVTSAPTVVGDVVAVGALVADGRKLDMPGGVVRGFDARTGALRWAFDPAPPGAPPLAPGPDGSPRFHRGTPNAWSTFSVDPERGLLFVPTGNPSVDFFRGTSRDGIDHYGSSVVALDGVTGEVVWHFQTVRHDVWDYDVSAQPTLLELRREGRRVPAVVQATKMGHLFLLHRETGEPVFPVEERPAPATDVPGERLSPTQPFPTFPGPLHPHRLEPQEAWGLTPWDRGRCRERLASLRNEGIFTPPSLEGSLLYPGTAGGSNWGGVAWDPERQLLILNQSRIAQALTLVPRERLDAALADGDSPLVGIMRQEGTPYALRHEVLVSPLGIPCSPPPWGTLLAVDLASGEVRWEVPFGTTRDMTPLPFGLELGMPSMGGPIATASGLVFVGAAMDDYLRAYDVETGEELWRARLPAGGQATPMTYRLRPGGRQYVVIAAGGHGTLGTRLGDWVIAYALPGESRRDHGSDR